MENKNPNRWQAPGNGKIFDSKFETPEKMTQRSIGVLKFILKSNNSISIKDYKSGIVNYLNNEYKHIGNHSIKEHFIGL